MKVNEYFWKTTSLTLLFGAHLEFSSYNPFLSAKFALVVAFIVFLIQFLSILPAMFKRGKNNDKEI